MKPVDHQVLVQLLCSRISCRSDQNLNLPETEHSAMLRWKYNGFNVQIVF